MLARINPNGGQNHFAAGLESLCELLAKADIVVSATSAADYIITLPMAQEAIERRISSSPLVLIDIAVPRDIDPAIANLPNVFLKDIDDLRSIVDRNIERRIQEIPKAEQIITEELKNFLATLSRLEAGPTIKELRDKFEAVRREELERHRAKLDDRSFSLLDEMTRRMMNRLLHSPIISLKEPAATGSTDDLMTRVEIVRQLFALDNNSKEV